MGVTLGEKYRDTISGFEGVAVGRYEYLYGCIRIGLEGLDKDGAPVERVFDEQRLEVVETKKPVETAAKAGGPQTSPTVRTAPSR
jgi:hypothetical protein